MQSHHDRNFARSTELPQPPKERERSVPECSHCELDVDDIRIPLFYLRAESRASKARVKGAADDLSRSTEHAARSYHGNLVARTLDGVRDQACVIADAIAHWRVRAQVENSHARPSHSARIGMAADGANKDYGIHGTNLREYAV